MIRLEGITKTYPMGNRELTVLHGVTFHVEPGEMVAAVVISPLRISSFNAFLIMRSASFRSFGVNVSMMLFPDPFRFFDTGFYDFRSSAHIRIRRFLDDLIDVLQRFVIVTEIIETFSQLILSTRINIDFHISGAIQEHSQIFSDC